MTSYCAMLNRECPSMQQYLTYYADKGMGFILSAAGGPRDWTVEDDVRQAAAAMLLRGINSTTSYTMPHLTGNKQIASKNLVAKVLLHMEYEHHKTV